MNPPKNKALPVATFTNQPAPDYLALLPMLVEDINQLDHLLRGADGQKGLLERVGVLESTVADMKSKIDVIYDHIINTPKADPPKEPPPEPAKPDEKLSVKSLWAVLIIALTALVTAIVEYITK